MGLYLDISKKVTVGNAQGSSYADREFDRFERVAVPTPNGQGWYDPAESPVMPAGVPWLDWEKFERDCSGLGRREG